MAGLILLLMLLATDPTITHCVSFLLYMLSGPALDGWRLLRKHDKIFWKFGRKPGGKTGMS